MQEPMEDTQDSQDTQTQDIQEDSQDLAQETPLENVFLPPSVHQSAIYTGESYSHFSDIPDVLRQDMSTECVLGVDEAGRGPVLGI